MKVMLLWTTILIGVILICWATIGNKSADIWERGSMWWYIPSFIIASLSSTISGIAIYRHFFQ